MSVARAMATLPAMSSAVAYGQNIMGTKPLHSGHLPINGLNLYYEVYGDLDARRPPLLVIPGAFMSVESMAAWAYALHPVSLLVSADRTFARERHQTRAPVGMRAQGQDEEGRARDERHGDRDQCRAPARQGRLG